VPGETGEVIRCDGQRGNSYRGRLQVQGEIWEFDADRSCQAGGAVKILGRRGRVLLVEVLEDPETQT